MFEDGWAVTRLAWVLAQAPSAATHAVLESLLDVALPRELQVLAAKAWDRQHAAMAAVAAAARVTATVCTERPDALLTLPVLSGVLRTGKCTLRQVTAFLDLTGDLRPDDVLAVDEAVSARAATMTVSGFRRVVRTTVAKLDSRTVAERKKARRPRIGVRCQPQPDGLLTIAATMPAPDGVAYASELNRRADATRTPDDDRSHGERQIDVLLAALSACPPAASVPVRPSRRVELQVVIDWQSLLTLRDDPAELIGYGPLAAAEVHAMLTDPGTTLRRLVTDPVTGVSLPDRC